MIDSINNQIANLEMLNSNIQNSETTTELKNYLTEAKIADENATKEGVINGLKTQSTELGAIISKYFTSNSNYQSLLTEFDSLKVSISALSSTSTSDEINAVKEQYKALRDKVKSIAKEVKTP